jgi:hypothetical protein
MSLAGKFGNFEIKQSDRISQEDKAWLDHWEELYKRALVANKSVYDIFKSVFSSYSEEDKEKYAYGSVLVDDFDVLKKIDALQNGYISNIFNYFSNKYKVSLDNDFPQSDIQYECRRYSRKDDVKELVVDVIDYHTVMDKIFDQLGGLSFKEKAIKEIKDKLKNKCYNSYRDEWEIKIKGNKLIYTGGYCSQSFGGDWHFNSTEFLRALLKALSYNTYDEAQSLYSLSKLYDSYYVTLNEDDFQNGFSCVEVGVEHIKFYKNGRIDITFQSGEFARNFAREWCGYTLV